MIPAFYPNPQAEAASMRRSALRAGCTISTLTIQDTPVGVRAVGNIECPDGWAAARMLVSLAAEDARTGGAQAIARRIWSTSTGNEDFARQVHAWVKANLRFEPEEGEIFQNGEVSLLLGHGDCDDHARLMYAIARAGGLPAILAFLHHGPEAPPDKQGPTHAVAQLCPTPGRCDWAESTVDAAYGEAPLDAALRLRVIADRDDLAREVITMSEHELPPVPVGYAAANPPGRLETDAQALGRLGFLGDPCGVTDPCDPVYRAAVAAFQRAAGGLTVDGLMGPNTRRAVGSALATNHPQDEFTMGYLGTIGAASRQYTGHLSPGFFGAVVDAVRQLNARGASLTPQDLASVLLSESGLRPNAGSHGYGGLNQIHERYLPDVGFPGDMADYKALTAEQQMPYVTRFLLQVASGHYGNLDSGGALYLLNFLPKYIGHAQEPDFVLAQQGAPGNSGTWYHDNPLFDPERKGSITVADMQKQVDRVKVQNASMWDEVQQRLIEDGGATPDYHVPELGPGTGTGGLVALAIATLGVLGAVAWHQT